MTNLKQLLNRLPLLPSTIQAILPAIGQMLMQIQMIVYGPFKAVPEWLHKLFLLFE